MNTPYQPGPTPNGSNQYIPPAWHPGPLPSGPTGATDPAPWTSVNPLPTVPTSPSLACRICGARPAVGVTIRAHQGLLVLMRFRSIEGSFCAVCGLALLREMTTKTLWQGWWSPLSLALFTPFTLLWNLLAYRRLRRLPLPLPIPGHPQMDPGKPVLHRPLAYAALIPVIWLIWVIVGATTSGT